MRISSLCWGVFFLGVGLFFLAINMGYLDHLVWLKLFSLWPVILIAIGIAVIFNRTKLKFLGLAAPLLIALTFVYVAASDWGYCYDYDYYYNSRSSSGYNREVYEYSVESDPDVKSLNVEMDFGLGELWIGATSKVLFDGDFEYRSTRPDCSHKMVGDECRIDIKSKDWRGFNIFRKRSLKNDARIFVADYLPLELNLDIGAAKVDLDMADHMLEKLYLDTGAAEVKLRLGCRLPKIDIDINAGASDLVIYVPHEMALEIDSDVALSSTNFKRIGLSKEHGVYRSDNFDSAECTAIINIDSGVSEINIDYY
jgi:hypothetical protein